MVVPTSVRTGVLGRAPNPGDALARIRCPVLVTHGVADQILLAGLGKFTAAAVPGAKLSLYDGVGHAPFWEDAPRFNRELAQFVDAANRSKRRSVRDADRFPGYCGSAGLVCDRNGLRGERELKSAPLTWTIDFFSYFTVIANILVTLAMTLPWLAPKYRLAQWFERPSVRTVLAVYIIMVGVVYQVLARKLGAPHVWGFVDNIILHYVIPTLFAIRLAALRSKARPIVESHLGGPRASDSLCGLDVPAWCSRGLLSLSLHQCNPTWL